MADLISRAAAIAEIEEYLHGLDSCISEPDLKLDGYRNGLQVAIQELKGLPAVDAAPVVHGRWIDHKDEHQCSVCKEFIVVDAYAWIQLRYDFCPYCGAKMDGEANERREAAEGRT